MNTITISHEAIVQNVIDEYLALLKKHQGDLYKDIEIVTRILNEARDENNPSRVLDCIAVLNVLTNSEVVA